MLTHLGHYRLIRQLGEGGMGTVYEAARDDGQFDQRVAIKILGPGVTRTDQFEAERRILAHLRHPYIASLIDGGSADGVPYIVMELINGVPIDEFVSKNFLTLNERLELFILVCEAVQHAHASLIVHRDLKPANILVTPDGIPKLLDFGIAKHHGTQSTLIAPLTPHYASPEQYSSSLITTSSDVYSLGVILRELLETCEKHDDLAKIVAMATRVEPHRRYGSVAQFSEDIRRYLDGMMVIAKPDTIGYRWSKFSSRNRIPLALSALLVLAVLGGLIFVYREGLRAQRRFEDVHGLLNAMLNEIDAEASHLVGSANVRQMMVEKALAYLNRLVKESGEDRKLLFELARAYHKVGDIQGHIRTQNLGRYNESLESHLKGIRIEEGLLAGDARNDALRSQLAWGYSHAAELYSMRGDSEKAKAMASLAGTLVNHSDTVAFLDTTIAISRILHFEGEPAKSFELLSQSLAETDPSAEPLRRASMLLWASEEAQYLGLAPLGLDYSNQAIRILEGANLRGNELSRLNVARRDRGIHLSQANNPSEERHCDAIADLKFAAEGQAEIQRQDARSINRLVQAVTAIQMLSASQALCGQPEAIATARSAIELYNRDKKRVNTDLEWHLAFAHIKLGQLREAAAVLAKIEQPDAPLQELMAEIAFSKGQTAEARSLLASARLKRSGELKMKHFEHRVWCYQQAANMRFALRAGDTTPGLREDALRLLSEFPATGVSRSISRLRSELKP